MSNKSVLVQTTQSGVYGIPVAATAGLMTTRGSTSSFFINGTNRAMFRFTLVAHLCMTWRRWRTSPVRRIASARM